MADSTSHVAKIKLKVGSMELEYEGAASFLTDGIEALLDTMGGLAHKMPAETPPPPSPSLDAKVQPANDAGNGGGPPKNSGQSSVTTNTIAAHLSAKTGSELAICALAQLELVQSKASSTRKEILAEMQNATTYYNKNMGGNLTKILAALTSNKRINQTAKDTYALSASERKQLEAKVADIK